MIWLVGTVKKVNGRGKVQLVAFFVDLRSFSPRWVIAINVVVIPRHCACVVQPECAVGGTTTTFTAPPHLH
jgi:hypothetical protein